MNKSDKLFLIERNYNVNKAENIQRIDCSGGHFAKIYQKEGYGVLFFDGECEISLKQIEKKEIYLDNVIIEGLLEKKIEIYSLPDYIKERKPLISFEGDLELVYQSSDDENTLEMKLRGTNREFQIGFSSGSSLLFIPLYKDINKKQEDFWKEFPEDTQKADFNLEERADKKVLIQEGRLIRDDKYLIGIFNYDDGYHIEVLTRRIYSNQLDGVNTFITDVNTFITYAERKEEPRVFGISGDNIPIELMQDYQCKIGTYVKFGNPILLANLVSHIEKFFGGL